MVEMDFLKKLRENPKLVEELGENKTEILEGKIVETVFLDSIQNINEPMFVAELLGLSLKSGIPKVYLHVLFDIFQGT